MKSLLTATTALALVGGAALAEITISGDAKLGLNYNSLPTDDAGYTVDNMSRHSFTHEMGIDFSGSGITDGGLSFGAKAGFDTGDDKVNTGTVFVNGTFGTITIGDNDSADKLSGGIADVGLNGVGVDDVVEDIYGTTDSQFRYDQSVGNIALAISAGTGTARDVKLYAPELKSSSYAVGMSFSGAGATVGLGYDSRKTISVGFGYGTGQISANAFYAKRDQSYMHIGTNIGDPADDGTYDVGITGLGIDLSYTVGASTLTMVYSRTDLSNIEPIIAADGTISSSVSASFKGMGIGFGHDLGGGLSLVAGFGKIPQWDIGDLVDLGPGLHVGQTLDYAPPPGVIDHRDRSDYSVKKNVASLGLSFSF